MFLPWLLSPLGKIAVTALAVLGVWWGFARHYENKGADKLLAKIEKKVEANAKEAGKIRKSIGSVPVERLRDAHTRD